MADSIPSPTADVIKLSDQGIAQYVELPADTHFVESIAQNPRYARGVGYVTVQRNLNGHSRETYVYEIRPGMAEAKRLFGPISTSHGTDVTIFGSALSSTGMLYLCAYNQNMVIQFDLENHPVVDGGTVRPNLEIGPIPSPNDVCIDPEDESRLYIAGGKFRTLHCLCVKWTNSARGQLFEARVNAQPTSFTTTIVAKNLKTLAGVGVANKKVWLAQLFDVITLAQGGSEATAATVWRGNDGKGQVWLADNIDSFNGLVLSPAYTTVSEAVVEKIMKQTLLSSVSMLCMQAASAQVEQENLLDALWDPEVDVRFSNTVITPGVPPPPVRLILMRPDAKAALHFEVDLEETRASHAPYEVKDKVGRTAQRHFFNEQVTHAAHLPAAEGGGAGWIACVNFEQPRVLLLDAAPFALAVANHPSFP